MIWGTFLFVLSGLTSNAVPAPSGTVKSRLYDLAASYRVIHIPTTDGSFDELVQRGNYNFVNPLITEEHFPLGPVSLDGADVILLQFDQDMEPRAVLDEMLRLKVRPATMRELLALGIVRDQEHIVDPIIALGALWLDQEQVLYEAHLARYGHGWVLNAGKLDHWYPKICLFAVVIPQQ